MLLQRAHGAESWVKNRLANGPLRVQSNEYIGNTALYKGVNYVCSKYSATLRCALIIRGMIVSCKVHGVYVMNQGGTADKYIRP